MLRARATAETASQRASACTTGSTTVSITKASATAPRLLGTALCDPLHSGRHHPAPAVRVGSLRRSLSLEFAVIVANHPALDARVGRAIYFISYLELP
jgi:hypothetical protein